MADDIDPATVEAVARAITRQYFLRVTTMFANTVRDGPEFMEAIAASTNECWRDHIEEARAAIAAWNTRASGWRLRQKTPAKWVCNVCRHEADHEAEVVCWKCGVGEMIYTPAPPAPDAGNSEKEDGQ